MRVNDCMFHGDKHFDMLLGRLVCENFSVMKDIKGQEVIWSPLENRRCTNQLHIGGWQS